MSVCKLCQQPLVLELDPEDFDEATSSAAGGSPSTVLDDLQLSCNCHFHWQCLLDESPAIANSFLCPSCSSPLAAQASESSMHTTSQIMVSYINEGGSSTLNILPLIVEEAYLDGNPSARPARAYLTMCSEGDVGGVVELLQNIVITAAEEEDEDAMSSIDLLRYQDPLDGGKSALHIAVAKGQMEIVWLLLWIASAMPSSTFPQQAVNAAMTMGAGRDIADQGVDIRTLKTGDGLTAGNIAVQGGGMMAELVRAGIL